MHVFQSHRRCLYAFGNEKPLNVLGTFEAELTLSGRKNERSKVTAKFVVIDRKGVSLLGGKLQKSWRF